jgi:hypothetical protein
MSGGHFDYNESQLDHIADKLEQDIEYNDITYENAIGEDYEEKYGNQLEPKTIEFLKTVVQQLRNMRTILHEYDYAVSGDTDEKIFQERVGIK